MLRVHLGRRPPPDTGPDFAFAIMSIWVAGPTEDFATVGTAGATEAAIAVEVGTTTSPSAGLGGTTAANCVIVLVRRSDPVRASHLTAPEHAPTLNLPVDRSSRLFLEPSARLDFHAPILFRGYDNKVP